ncbi:hypothetical protein ACERIT_11865 [Halopenitus sp. H-Gu1]|uniref:hypothetical protein n=1 Tax=Halopenitus sp. H-Gu1 TaxID=3242697 RepID=UPI00359CFA39
MLARLATSPVVKLLQVGYYLISIGIVLAWFGFTAFLLLQGAYEVGGVFVIMTILIGLLAYFNERPD